MRVFIAINLPDNVKKALESLISVLEKENKDQPIKFVEPQLLHITLHFLGDLDQNEADKVTEVLEKTIGNFSKMKFKPGELGGFPDLKNPRIIFVKGIEIGDGEVVKLHHKLFHQLQDLGFEVEDRKWISHITIGRVKGRVSGLKAVEKVKIEPVEWEATSVDLVESVLDSNGPIYKIIRKFELK